MIPILRQIAHKKAITRLASGPAAVARANLAVDCEKAALLIGTGFAHPKTKLN